MSETTQYLMFFGLLWGSALAAWLWIRRRLRRDAEAERLAREEWSRVHPRTGCERTIPGCICARDNLGPWCVWRRPDSQPHNGAVTPAAEGRPVDRRVKPLAPKRERL